MTTCSWLPPIIKVNPWTQTTFDDLYQIFCEDFVQTQPEYEGKKVWYFKEMESEKLKIFWHLTSGGEGKPDMFRAERLRWIKAMICNPNKPEMKVWDYKEADSAIKTYLWLEDEDFLVIMKRYSQGKGHRLITSFPTDFEFTRRKMNAKFDRRIIV